MQDSEDQELEGLGLMLSIPKPLRGDAFKLIPTSHWPICTCCVVYDGHPRDNKRIDITICVQGGKVIEIYQREPVSYIEVPNVSELEEIRILRNNKGALYYLVVATDKLFILSSKDSLSIHRNFCGVTSYEICDPDGSGEPKLIILTGLSMTYVSIANDFEIIEQGATTMLEPTQPVIVDLKKKMIEAKYTLQCNKKAYKQIETLRQQATFLCKEDVQPITLEPIITFCNKKIVIHLQVENPYKESMENVYVLLHNSSCNSISYTGTVYEHLQTSPFYRELVHRDIKRNCKALVVAVIPIKEFKNSVSSRIELNFILTYERQGKDYLKAFDVYISAGDVMGNNFDVFNSSEVGDRSMVLAMLSTSIKTTLCFNLKGIEGDMTTPSTIFCKYLKMEYLKELKEVVVHKYSPHHILHGIMIIFDDEHNYIDLQKNEFNFKIDVYTRSPTQVQALIQFVYDKVPLTLIITTPNINLISHESSAGNNLLNTDCCSDTLLKQCSMTLKYLSDCRKEMNKKSMKNKAIEEIDLLAMGQEEFTKYRNKMLAGAEDAIDQIVKSDSQTCDADEVMEVDDS